MKTDVIIIGAGVLGVSLAYHLAQANKSCVVIEREKIPGVHASGKNAGMFRQLYRHPQLTDWASRSLKLWPEELRQAAFKKTSSYIVGRQSPAHHSAIFADRHLRLGSPFQEVEVSAVFTESDGLIDPGIYLNTLYRMIDKSVVSIKFGETVINLHHDSRNWIVRTNMGLTISAPHIVNAAGAWLNSFLVGNSHFLAVSTQAYARHLFVTKGWDIGYMPASDCGYFWDEVQDWYLRKWSADERLVSVCDRFPADPDTFAERLEVREVLAEKLLLVIPGIAPRLSIGQSWCCFRTYTEDQLPIWGPDPLAHGVFWLAAFGGFGMSTSFAASFDAARYLCGRKVEVTSDFSPTRTRAKELRRVATNL